MPDHTPQLPKRQRLKLQVLLPISLGLLVLLALYAVSTFWFLNRQVERELEHKISEINYSFNNMLEQRAQIMLVQLEQLAESKELQRLMLRRDRQELLNATQATFEKLLQHLHISHFYFHNPDRTVFLRVHKPSKYGDYISRYGLQKAAKSHHSTSGMELGPLGTFTLRTVLPWYQENKLLGYLELGEEVDLLISKFFQFDKTVLTFTINKKFLNHKEWAIGMEMLGKDPASWNLLPDRVVIQTSSPELLSSISNLLTKDGTRFNNTVKFTADGNSYLARFQPLHDFSGRQVGDFLLVSDITTTVSDYWRTVFVFASLYLTAAGAFLFSTTIFLGRTEKALKTSNKQLVDEMLKVHKSNIMLEKEVNERKTAEKALSKIQDELEERVTERTEQLWLSLEQTQQVRKQLNDIVTSVPDGLIVTDLDGQILLLNQQAEKMFQCSATDSIGHPLRSIIHDPAIAQKMEEALQQQLSGLRFDVVQIAADLQTIMSLQIRTSNLTDRQGKSIGLIFLIHDISQEREIERLKSEFITTAVHELSTPLTAILGFSEFLLENKELSKEEEGEFLSIINEKADFLSGLVGELLDISRIESGKPLPLQKEFYSAQELFEKPIQHLNQLSEDHSITICLHSPDSKLLADKEKIWQVMENLCSNAIKYSPSGSAIRITGQATENSYRVTVSDQGVGLTKDQTTKVFEKFYRCNQTDTAVGGTGLGLTIVKHIIEGHNGQIWVESELGQGTKVHFVLPLKS
ncbi:ATP-binding protein [Malonomonas rubra]|uniref:ATP-binding protein n=1 Tax=Malonomonas rubra TaxID=57040 RepID=UPI0026E9DA4D|nr:ATP-binding protein [Malonomonas rubra]